MKTTFWVVLVSGWISCSRPATLVWPGSACWSSGLDCLSNGLAEEPKTNTLTAVITGAHSASSEPAHVYWSSRLTWTPSCFSLPPTFNTLREFALFILRIKQQQQQHDVLESMPGNAGARSTGLPSIPWTHFFHIVSSQLSDQFLTASAYRLPEFGEGSAALQVIESFLS